MTKKDDKNIKSKKDSAYKKIVIQKGEELVKWKAENAAQRRFFSLEEKEQRLLEKTYIIFAQVCPELTWQDYIDRLRISERQDSVTKAVLKKIL